MTTLRWCVHAGMFGRILTFLHLDIGHSFYSEKHEAVDLLNPTILNGQKSVRNL